MAFKNVSSSNSSYKKRADKRARRLGPDGVKGVAGNLVADRLRRNPADRKYSYADLQGTDRIEMLRMVRDCAMAAMTEFEIATYFGVSVSALTEWCMKDLEFAVAMRLPKDLADDRVVRAIYHKAVGYSFQAEEIKITEGGDVHRVPIVKHVPPDLGAGVFWLKNRRSAEWKDKVDVDASLAVDVSVEDKSMDPRSLAMAVIDVMQRAMYEKLPATIDGEPVVAKQGIASYTDEEIENMSPEELEALFEAGDESDDSET